MIATDNVVDIFSFNPSLAFFEGLSSFQQQEILKRGITLSKIMLHSWQQEMKIKAIDVVDQCVKDSDLDSITTLILELQETKNIDLFLSYIFSATAKSNLFIPVVEAICDNFDVTMNDLAVNAAKGGYLHIIEEAVEYNIDHEEIAEAAAENCQLEIVKYLYLSGSISKYSLRDAAAKGG